MLVETAPERSDSARRTYRNIGPLEGKNPEVILLHASETDQGGIVAATIFYAAALIAAGHPAEIWTPSLALANRAKVLGVPVFCHKAFRNAAGPR